MAQERNGMSRNTMLVVAGVAGAVVLVAFWLLAAYGFFGALVLGVIVAVVVYLILFYGFGGPVEGEVAHPVDRPAPAPATSEAEAEHILHAPSDDEAYDEDYEEMAPATRPGAAPEPAGETPGETPAAESPAEAPVAPAAPAPTPAPAPAPADGDGTKPPTLDAARAGGPDNLKEIKGVGPKLETQLNEMGIYHFDQIAAWGPAEVAWMDGNLKGFRGRVSRDDWVAQARILAGGGDTEFSSRVDKGEVY
ncbi:hypothetical protein P1J78_00640 [Psychromarinibacter sp. C21-152]|uniref:Uncharacterized protein n=1 Tax=Psychromarinibacter sediminicola TaxID=3033385 RepID=A0AAE3T6F9_9RHOB|nr:hypothetical protein [Psychromarinibacter sediminicola]MDF0599225.1 hypothetical protein [Psychromarinibacter sediminicola]